MVQRLIDDQLAGRRSRTQLLLAITMLELWLTSFRRSRADAVTLTL